AIGRAQSTDPIEGRAWRRVTPAYPSLGEALGVASRPAWGCSCCCARSKSMLLRRRERGTDGVLARDERGQCQGIARSLGLLGQLEDAGQRLLQACHGFAPQVLCDHAGEKPPAWLMRGKCSAPSPMEGMARCKHETGRNGGTGARYWPQAKPRRSDHEFPHPRPCRREF